MTMEKSEKALKILSSAVNGFILLSMLLVLAYSAYSLWDNRQVITAAENVRSEMIRIKPEPDESGRPDFSQLHEINPDVVGWISLPNTEIDYPILQGKDNLSYITTDVYGKYAVAGSIFLDTRCSADFSDRYSLVYGHHMANGSMFGDLDKYRSERFFYDNLTGGRLITTNGVCELELAAVLEISSYDSVMFSPGDFSMEDRIDFISRSAKFLNQFENMLSRDQNTVRLIALSTCSVDYTDARTVVVFVICEE
jgi:sortase B